ncbi:MAG: hypothetical protein ACXVAO_09350 [Vulcanimicrobiaceae bacterium]
MTSASAFAIVTFGSDSIAAPTFASALRRSCSVGFLTLALTVGIDDRGKGLRGQLRHGAARPEEQRESRGRRGRVNDAGGRYHYAGGPHTGRRHADDGRGYLRPEVGSR